MISKTIIPIEVLTIEDDGHHLLINVKLNNKKAVMLIDTGASKSVFDKKRIENFVDEKKFKKMDKLSSGLGTNEMQTHSVIIRQVKIGKLIINNFKTILLDLSNVNTSYEKLGFPPIDGVFGGDLLHHYNAVIDYKANEIRLKWKK